MRATGVLLSLVFMVSGPATAEQTSAEKKAIVKPSVIALSNCVAFNVVQSSNGSTISKENISAKLTSALDACYSFKSEMIRIYDLTFGQNSGQQFFDGPYKHDLNRAVFQRINSGTIRMPAAPQNKPAEQAPPLVAVVPETQTSSISSTTVSENQAVNPEIIPILDVNDLCHATYGRSIGTFEADCVSENQLYYNASKRTWTNYSENTRKYCVGLVKDNSMRDNPKPYYIWG